MQPDFRSVGPVRNSSRKGRRPETDSFRTGLLAAVSSLAACGGSLASEGGGGDASSKATNSEDASPLIHEGGPPASASCVPMISPTPATCNGLVPTGNVVVPTCVTESPTSLPAPQGGTIADGTYVFASSTIGNCGSMPAPSRGIEVVCGSSWQVADDQGPGSWAMTANKTVTTSGTQLTLEKNCAMGGTSPTTYVVGYTATPTSITLIDTNNPSSPLIAVWIRM
jgi:hypothetical protein